MQHPQQPRHRQSPITEQQLPHLLSTQSSHHRLSTVTYRILTTVILLATVCLPTVAAAPATCAPQVNFGSSKSTVPNPEPTIYANSNDCVHEIKQRGGKENTTLSPWNPCKAEAMDIKLSSHLLFPSGTDNFLPFARLNISVTVFDRSIAESIFIRFECIEAVSGDDSYCHALPPKHIAEFGRTIWPCRGAQVGGVEGNTSTPYTFSFDCFHLFPNSQYYVNVTAFPEGCSSTLVITIPELVNAYPKLAVWHQNGKDPSTVPWSPMLIVDMTASEDGVWLRTATPPDAPWRVIEMSLYKVSESTGTGLVLLKEFVLKRDDMQGEGIGVKWSDADEGEYVLIGHVPRHDCSLMCGESTSSSCRLCPHTRLPFRLERDYLTPATAALRKTKDVGVWVAPMGIGLLAACTLLVFIYVRRARRKAARRTRDVALVERPLTLLLYSDDCEEHAAVVREIASLLESCAQVAFDQEDLLVNGSLIPYDWLGRSLAAAAKIVVVLSPSTPILLQREKQLISRRPFPDMLQPAFKEISKDLCSAHPRVIFVSLPYSPELPEEWARLGGHSISLPSQYPLLVSAIHGVSTDGRKEISLAGQDDQSLSSLVQAVETMENYIRERGEGWIEGRMEPIDTRRLDAFDTGKIEMRRAGVPLSMNHTMQEGLLPPDEEEETGFNGEASLLHKIQSAPAAVGAAAAAKYNHDSREHALLPPDSDSD